MSHFQPVVQVVCRNSQLLHRTGPVPAEAQVALAAPAAAVVHRVELEKVSVRHAQHSPENLSLILSLAGCFLLVRFFLFWALI